MRNHLLLMKDLKHINLVLLHLLCVPGGALCAWPENVDMHCYWNILFCQPLLIFLSIIFPKRWIKQCTSQPWHFSSYGSKISIDWYSTEAHTESFPLIKDHFYIHFKFLIIVLRLSVLLSWNIRAAVSLLQLLASCGNAAPMFSIRVLWE